MATLKRVPLPFNGAIPSVRAPRGTWATLPFNGAVPEVRDPRGTWATLPAELEALSRQQVDQLAAVVATMTPLAEQIANALKTEPEPKTKPKRETRGRPAKLDMVVATLAVFGKIYRADVPTPKKLAEVERLLADWISVNCDEEIGETQIREYAKKIWEEVGK